MSVDAFFAYARERHSTHLRRAAGLPRGQWTQDPILQQYRFCNVYRELDRTTIWFREHVRDRLRDDPDVLLATVLFRWFNRIQTGEAIFLQSGIHAQDGSLTSHAAAWDCRGGKARDWIRVLEASIRQYCGRGPYVTGSYIIKTPDGMDKLRGVLDCVEQFCLGDWQEFALTPESRPVTLEDYWGWLKRHAYLGDFMAYEIVTDLRHTMQLDRAPDIMTWANPGPGARRGLNRIHGRPLENSTPRAQLIREMQMLLAHSQQPFYWPQFQRIRHDLVDCQFPGDLDIRKYPDWVDEKLWPAWEMREVEHTLCEWDKFERMRLGQGKMKMKFR